MLFRSYHESEGVGYINQESFEELLCFLQLPALLSIAAERSGEKLKARNVSLQAVEAGVLEERKRMEEAGYRLGDYLEPAQSEQEAEAEPVTK